ncbi:4-(cytidine 5'-diphospho)-2-C-methyl-D-erythritol kinase [Marinilabiliaceae bacterium ANBcel2]|nr:4-(cytidine 5'-diphospho)-2-C-methyl-D-erythritol kinase [Marinilabiliaceae bacterium ANBcel2]
MIVFPNAKINAGLFITEKRQDGFHNIETLFLPVFKLYDILEVITNHDSTDDKFTCSGIPVNGSSNNNLCIKAIKLLREIEEIPPLKIHLHKVIPLGAGLGGGSSDAAFMLKLLNQQYNCNLTNEKLEELAIRLGSDCPVFIKNRPVAAVGKGEIFSKAKVDLNNYYLTIIKPLNINISTAEAYKNCTVTKPKTPLKKLTELPVERWRGKVINDFEKEITKKYPEIKEIKEKMYKNSALYASMSGSGSSVFGLFKNPPDIKWPNNYFVHNEKIYY